MICLNGWKRKITKTADYMNSVKDYLTHQMGRKRLIFILIGVNNGH